MGNTTTFGGTIKLEGEREYRQAISQINGDLRVLGSEMSKVTAEFGKNDKSVEGLASRNKILSEQIDKQKDKINTLKGALENSSEKYGENDKKTQGWQVQLNKAEAQLISMEKELGNNKKAMEEGTKATDESKENLNEFGESAKEAGNKALTLGDIIKANLISHAIIEGLKMLGNAFKDAFGYVKDSITNAAKYGDSMLEMSTKTGVSTKTLQELSAVAELLDVDLNTITSSMTKNIKSMSSAADGSKTASEAYSKLGINVKDANGQLRNSESVYWETIDALRNMENETERDALAMQVLGKSAQELNPLIKMSAQDLEELKNKAYDMGSVLSEDTLNSLGNLDDQMQIWQGTLKATANLIGALFAPAMTEIMESANEVGSAFNNLIVAIMNGEEDIDAQMEEFSQAITRLTLKIAEKMPEFLKLGGIIIKSIFDGLMGAIINFLPQIAPGLLLISGAIVAFGPTLMAAFTTLAPIVSSGLALLSSLVITWPIALGAAIIGALALFWPQISSLFSNIWSGLSNFISNLWNNIKNFLSENWSSILLFITSWPLALIKTLSNFWPQISSFLNNLWLNISNYLSTTFNNISNWFKNLSSNMSIKSKEAIDTTINWFKQLPSSILNAISSAITNIISWGNQLVSKGREAAQNLTNTVINGIKNLPNELTNIGKNLINGLWNGISSSIKWLTDKIKSFANGVMSSIKSFFGIASPSKLFRDQIGKNLALGLGEGFKDEMKTISKDMQSAIPTSFDTDINPNLNNLNDLSTLTNSPLTKNSTTSSNSNTDSLISTFKEALSGMAFMIDGDKFGELAISKIERVIYS